MRASLRSFRPLLGAVASAAVVLASCAAAGEVDAPAPVPGGPRPSAEEPADVRDDDPADPNDGTDGAHPAPDHDDARHEPEPAAVPVHAPAPDPAGPFVLSSDETLPNAKRLASDMVQNLLTYDPDDEPAQIVDEVADDPGASRLLLAAAPVLHPGAWSRGEIVYPQLGGFTDTAASVMVVARQSVGYPDGEVVEETRTFDVRLRVEDGAWVFDELASAGGRPVERPAELSELAAAVVDDDRIELPDSARWDIYLGTIEPAVLQLMAVMADRNRYGVVVLDTGHPWEIFGTERQSSHSRGRAVDVYRLEESLVIDDREDDSELHRFVQWLYERPRLANVGSPWALDDFGGRSFTDQLHQDHLHVEAGPPRTD